ncbi:hypothetical protein FA95DRAFT_1601173 [Auriscalpium vulgare]|uniref:Uncharacterized protein n=1 Tax=Auriscalpium vulgare TaxID=40419 RepID=A0ACB8S9Z4_9AGAM|nr:hypothetical protein FA95DRAFT_1601173 [Auriscalpium vulgare]
MPALHLPSQEYRAMPSVDPNATCGTCSAKFPSVAKKKAHVRDKHWPVCNNCSEKLPSRRHLAEHQRGQCSRSKFRSSKPAGGASASAASPVTKKVERSRNKPSPTPLTAAGSEGVSSHTAVVVDESTSNPTVVERPAPASDSAVVEPAPPPNTSAAATPAASTAEDIGTPPQHHDRICTKGACDLKFETARAWNVHLALVHGIIDPENEKDTTLQDWCNWHYFLGDSRPKCITCQELFNADSELRQHVCLYGVDASDEQ